MNHFNDDGDLVIEHISLSELAQQAAEIAPGRWSWAGYSKHGIHLRFWKSGWGACTVMDFARHGMNGAQPRFFPLDGIHMQKASDHVVFEVAHRDDIVAIDHPIARYMAAVDPTTILGLIDKADQWDAAQPMIEAMTEVVGADQRWLHSSKDDDEAQAAWEIELGLGKIDELTSANAQEAK